MNSRTNLDRIFPVNRENAIMGMRARREWIKENNQRAKVEKLVAYEDKIKWAIDTTK